jgi:hypothetical protein
MRAPLWVALAIAACSSARLGSQETGTPSLVWPARYAEGDNDGGGASPSGAGTEDALPSDAGAPSAPPFAPDPEPLALREQYEMELRYARGTVRVESIRSRTFDKPVPTAREMGRFAIELWIGHELVDRVRFNFPLLGAEPAPTGKRRPLKQPPTFSAASDVRRTVLVPKSDRATSARIIDRATGEIVPLPWPPESPLDPQTGESGR